MKTCPQCGDTHEQNGRFCSRACGNRYAIAHMAPRVCAIPTCGATFQPGGKSAKFCSPKHNVVCVDCGKGFMVVSRIWEGREACNRCTRFRAAAKAKVTNLDRHGVENAMQLESTKAKSRETTRAKHGVDYYTQTEEYREKVAVSNLEKYGVEHTFQRDDVKKHIEDTLDERYGGHHLKTQESMDRLRATNKERYGVEIVSQSEAVKARIRETNQERYGVEMSLLNPEVDAKRRATWAAKYDGHPMKNPEIQAKVRATLMERYGAEQTFAATSIQMKARVTMLDRYGAEYALQNESLLEKQMKTTEERIASGEIKPQRISKLNQNFAKKLEGKFGVQVILEKTVGKYSFDLAIEGKSLLIELNPTVSHNLSLPFKCLLKKCEMPCASGHPKILNDYHFKRAQAAQAEGYSLIQIYDWDSEEAVMALLAGKLEKGFTRHSSRKLSLRVIPQKEANAFLRENHIQGGAKEQSHCYGMYSSGGELLAVATFGASRFKAKEEYEWIRYAVKRGHVIHGGPNRMWRAFLEEASPESVISYVDFDHTTAPKIFLSGCGFEEDSPTGPSVIWSKGAERIYSNSLLRLGADRLLKTAYGRPEECGLNNEAIMLLEGWLPVATAGNRVFTWTPTFQETAG